jgi:hypothetical protein
MRIVSQIERPIPTERDDEIEHVIITDAGSEDAKLNERIIIEQPVKWWINNSGGSVKMYKSGRLDGNFDATSKYHQLCCQFPRDASHLWRTISGERVRPTQISSLLSQNPSGPSRSPSFCYRWDQADEAYYIAKARAGLAEFRAETDPDYSYVSELSEYRGLFRCPARLSLLERRGPAPLGKRSLCGISTSSAGDDGGDFLDYGRGAGELPGGVPDDLRGPISIYINPKTGQATWICPRCTYNNKKEFGGSGYPIYHPVTREMRTILEVDKIIPTKEYKYRDRTEDIPYIIELVNQHPGITYYGIDNALNLPKNTAKRIIEKEMVGLVELRQKKEKIRVYPICKAPFS